LYIHGLGSDARSRYGLRIAGRFFAKGVSVFRMDMRGAGLSMPLAASPYHAGRSGDVVAALARIAQLCPGSPIGAVGVSLGGHMLLKALGEAGLGMHPDLPQRLTSAAAVCPPLQLSRCSRLLNLPRNAFYNRRMVRHLLRAVATYRRVRPDALFPCPEPPPTTMADFDQLIAAPLASYDCSQRYYRSCETIGLLGHIRLPTLLLMAKDDPLIAWRGVSRLPASAMPQVVRELPDGGGHVGFIGPPLPGVGCWWLDGRLMSWFLPRLPGEG
jgi:predicted alpha/beta-fold hydrolase